MATTFTLRFGMFVDIGSKRDGLVHVKDISKDYFINNHQSVRIQFDIRLISILYVYVASVNRSDQIVSLMPRSFFSLLPMP
jgi:Ribonuclease G/E